jgi:hypothetical protein
MPESHATGEVVEDQFTFMEREVGGQDAESESHHAEGLRGESGGGGGGGVGPGKHRMATHQVKHDTRLLHDTNCAPLNRADGASVL